MLEFGNTYYHSPDLVSTSPFKGVASIIAADATIVNTAKSIMGRCSTQMLVKLLLMVYKKLQLLISWSPALQGDFMTKGSKALYWEFQYTLYSPQLTQLFAINIVFYVALEVFLIFNSHNGFHHYFTAVAIAAHILFIVLQYTAGRFLQKIHYVPVIISILMLYHILNSYVLEFSLSNSYNVLALLMSVFYFQNSTALTVIFILAQCFTNLYLYISSSISRNGNAEQVIKLHATQFGNINSSLQSS